MKYNFKASTEQGVNQVFDLLTAYDRLSVFKENTLSDKIFGFGSSVTKRQHKDTRYVLHSRDILKNDARIGKALNSLYGNILDSRNKDPEFYGKASKYLTEISAIGGTLAKLKERDSRQGISYAISRMLDRLESEVGITNEENKDINDQLQHSASRDAEESYSAFMKQIQQSSEQTGQSQDTLVNILKNFISEYELSKKKK
jgi:hypothetical protein